MDDMKILALVECNNEEEVPPEVKDSRFVIVDGQLVEVQVDSDDFDLFPTASLQWELGEVTLTPEYDSLELGDVAKIEQAQDNPILRGLGLEPGATLEVVLTISSF